MLFRSGGGHKGAAGASMKLPLDEAVKACLLYTSEFNAVTDERMARELVEQRRQAQKDALAKMNQKVTLDNLLAKMQEGEMKELPLIVKALSLIHI